MKPACNQRVWILLPLIMLLVVLHSTAMGADLTPQAMEKIDAALPEKPAVRPHGPRRMLIFSRCEGFAHGSIPIGQYALKRLGEKTGAYEPVVSDDISMFQRDKLADFDAVLFNNSTGTLFEDPALKQSLMDFVRSGKGIVGIHAATDCFYDWPEFGEMMGGYFDGHPWHEEVTLRLDEPDHPLVAAFGGKPFVVVDEIYQFKDPYSRDRLRVLLSLDPTANDIFKQGVKRSDHDFAVSWVRSWGEGRVFYCSLGHRDEIFWNPVVLRHYLDGIQFAMGDLPADAAPSAALAGPSGGAMSLEEAMAAAMTYELGASRLPLSVIAEEVRAALEDAPRRAAILADLHDLLGSDGATDACKSFVCRQLALIGGDESIEALAALLPDPNLSHMARYALERIPGPAVDTALRKALVELDGGLRIGVINSIGRRGDGRAMSELRRIAETGDADTLRAVVDAAGKIGGMNAEGLIFRAHAMAEENEDAALKAALVEPLIRIAERHMAKGDFAKAKSMFVRLYEGDYPKSARIASMRGLAFADPLGSLEIVVDLLGDEDPQWSGTAARLIADLPGEQITRELAGALGGLPDEVKVRLIAALAERGDRVAGPAVSDVIGKSSKHVDVAAVRALGVLGDATSVPLLARIASTEGHPARSSLDQLQGDDVDAAMASVMEDAPPPVRLELARSLGARGAVSQIQALLTHAEFDRDRLVRAQSFKSIGTLAGSDRVAEIVRVLVNAYAADDREAAGDCIVKIYQRVGDRDCCAQPAIEALQESDRASVRRALLRTLGQIGGEPAFQAVRQAVSEGGPTVDAALAALTDWPDAAATVDLLSLAQLSSDPDLRKAAFRGFVRTAGLPSDRADEETADMFGQVLVVAIDDEETRLALAGLARIGHLDAVKLAERYLTDPDVGRDAAAAVLASAGAVGEEHPEEAVAAVRRVMNAFPEDDDLRSQAGQAVDHIERNRDFIRTWRFAGPYSRDKHGLSQVFDDVFPPESVTAEAIEWRTLPDEAFVAPGIFDFLKTGGGSNCCGYVVTEIVSPTARQARLEIGSDDGVKVWLNGEVVHANNAARGLSIGQDIVDVNLKTGLNILMLKITQGGGDWRFCCRLRSGEGFHLEGVRTRLPQ